MSAPTRSEPRREPVEKIVALFGFRDVGKQGGDTGAEQGFAPALGIVHELEDGEIAGQLVLRDAPVWSQPRAPQGPNPLHGVQDITVNPRNGDQVMAQARATATPELRKKLERRQVPSGHAYSRTLHTDANGQPVLEQWVIHGADHAWSGGSRAGSDTDPRWFRHRSARARRDPGEAPLFP